MDEWLRSVEQNLLLLSVCEVPRVDPAHRARRLQSGPQRRVRAGQAGARETTLRPGRPRAGRGEPRVPPLRGAPAPCRKPDSSLWGPLFSILPIRPGGRMGPKVGAPDRKPTSPLPPGAAGPAHAPWPCRASVSTPGTRERTVVSALFNASLLRLR